MLDSVFEVIVVAFGDEDEDDAVLTPQPVLYVADDAEQAKQMAVAAGLLGERKVSEVAILCRPFCSR